MIFFLEQMCTALENIQIYTSRDSAFGNTTKQTLFAQNQEKNEYKQKCTCGRDGYQIFKCFRFLTY